MVENATDYKYSSAMCHAGLVNNSLVTDYDIGVLPILVDDIKISSTSDTLVIGESAQLHVTISPNEEIDHLLTPPEA
jgi:uncharacterized protein YjdB